MVRRVAQKLRPASRVLAAMGSVPRHEFVSGEAADAYDAAAVEGVASMIDALAPETPGTCLLVGAGSGYEAALLSLLCRQVFVVDPAPDRAKAAHARLRRLGYRNVVVGNAQTSAGWPEHAPYHRMLLSVSAPDVPQALVDQLGPGGRLVALTADTAERELLVVSKADDGSVTRKSLRRARAGSAAGDDLMTQPGGDPR